MNPSLFVLAATLIVAANAAKLPSTWKTCKWSLPPTEYEPCITNAVKGAVEDIVKNGVPSLGVPNLDPLKISALDIAQGSGPVSIDLKFRNMEVHGFTDLEINKIRHQDANNYKFGADVSFKKPVIINAKYELGGKVLVLPIKGKGDCELQLDNVRGKLDIVGEPVKKGDKTYANVTTLDFNIDTDRLHLKFDNLFDGNKQLGDNMNVFLNENWEVILKELKPTIFEALSQVFKAYSNQIFSKIPYNKIIPE